MSESTDTPIPITESGSETEIRYVAFCDILGFSGRILTDFDNTLKTYREFGSLASGGTTFKEVKTTMYSDAILITGVSLARILSAAQGLWFFALANNFMLRGAITKGRYWEQRLGSNMLVASDALVRSVKLEKSIGIPAVVIADDVDIPDEYWLARFQGGPFVTPLLHFRDRNIVNPFNLMWGRSAATRAAILMNEHPEHKDKYQWLIALHEAVASGRELIPPDVLNRFLRQGVLRFTHPKTEEKPDGGPAARN